MLRANASKNNTTNETKQGSVCCGGCCDMRRAVFIVNIIYAVLSAIALILLYSGSEFLIQQIDDDVIKEHFEDTKTISYIMAAIGMGVSLVGIWGAYTYNILAVGASALFIVVAYIVELSLAIQFSNSYDLPTPTLQIVINAVVDTLLVYPHVGLIREINNGIMTPETYPREKASCCCV